MKRLHVHAGVPNIDEAVRFYSALFGAEPAVVKHDYARWVLDEPALKFAVSRNTAVTGVSHLGLAADGEDELDELYDRAEAASGRKAENETVACCYAKSDKAWLMDPAGVQWEIFRTFGDADQLQACPTEKVA